jgi:hypothetical protein
MLYSIPKNSKLKDSFIACCVIDIGIHLINEEKTFFHLRLGLRKHINGLKVNSGKKEEFQLK